LHLEHESSTMSLAAHCHGESLANLIIAVLHRWGRLRSGPQILKSHVYPFLTDVTSLIVADPDEPTVLSLVAATGLELWSWRPPQTVSNMSVTNAQGGSVLAVMYSEHVVQGQAGGSNGDSPSVLPEDSDADVSHRCSMSLLDNTSGKELWRRCLGRRDSAPRATFSPDAKAIALSGYGYTDTEEGGLMMLDSASGDCLWEFSTGGLFYCVSFAPDSRKVAAVFVRINNGHHLVVLDAAHGSWDSALWVEDAEFSKADIGMTFSNDSRTIISAQFCQEHQATIIVLWDASSGAMRWQTSLEGSSVLSAPSLLNSPDGSIIAVSLCGSIGMLSVETGELIWRRTHRIPFHYGLEFSLSGQMILAKTWDTIDALDPQSGHLMWQFAPEGHPCVVRSCGKWVAVACGDGVVRVLNAASGKQLWKWGCHGSERHNTCETLEAPGVAFALGGSFGIHVAGSGSTKDGMMEELPELRCPRSVLDDEIQHPLEPALSSDEAFARTAERNIAAGQAGVPVGQVTPDWAARSVIFDAGLGEQHGEEIAMAESRSLLDEAGVRGAASSVPEPVHLLELSRTPESFGRCLETHPMLRDCRCDLQRRGLPVELASGARIFVTVDQYGPVLSAIEAIQEKLRPRHVIAQKQFLIAITEAVESLSGGKQVHEKRANRRLLLPLNSSEAAHGSASAVREVQDVEEVNQEEEGEVLAELPVFIIKNTLFHVPIPSSLASEPSSGANTV